MNRPVPMRTAVAAAVFAAAFVVYVLTLAPGTGFVDQGHLTIAAWSLGNAHPPGFPLYLLITHLFTVIPFGTIALRANLASAFFAAAACAFLALAVDEALDRTAREERRSALSFVPMLTAGLLLAFSRTLWSWATIAEVYALNTFLIVVIVWLALRWRATRSPRLALAVAALGGLALGVHHLTVGITLIGVAVFFAIAGGRDFLVSRLLPACVGVALLATVAVYAYLPITAARHPLLNWGDPGTLSRAIDHVAAKQYHSYVAAEVRGGQADDLIRLLTTDLGAAGLPLVLAAIGLWFLLRRDPALFAALLTASLPLCGWVLFYPISNDKEAYLLPVFVSLAMAAGVGVAVLVRRHVVFAAVLMLPLAAAAMHWQLRDRGRFIAPRLAAENVVRGVAPNGLVITNDQFLYGPLFYLQAAEKLRPDVVVLQHALLTRSWYLDGLERRHPELTKPVRRELDALSGPIALFEGRTPPGNDSPEADQLRARLDELVIALIRTRIGAGQRVYATYDAAYRPESVGGALVQHIAATYDVVPRGLAFELVSGRSAERTMQPIDVRGLGDGSVVYEPNDVVRMFVIPGYRDVLLHRGEQLIARGQFAAAAREYRNALELDPSDTVLAGNVQRLEQRARE